MKIRSQIRTKQFVSLLALCAMLTGAALGRGSASAQNLIVNGGFEDPPGVQTWIVFGAGATLPGWVVGNGTVEIVGTFWQAAEGSQSLDLNGIFEEIGTIYQDVPTVPGQHYKVRFAYAGNLDCGPTIKTTLVTWDGQELDTVSFDTTGHSFTDMGWSYYEFEVTASSSTGRLGFQSLTSSFCGPVLDNVSVELVQDQPPVLNSLWASPAVLWPPNNKMVPVTLIVDATDDFSAPTSRIVSVTCNEAMVRGIRNADFEITGPLSLKLRATRLGQNPGRIYSVVVETTDSAGQSARAEARVSVPH
jgi:choice-of-anchor C domain-containing protein